MLVNFLLNFVFLDRQTKSETPFRTREGPVTRLSNSHAEKDDNAKPEPNEENDADEEDDNSQESEKAENNSDNDDNDVSWLTVYMYTILLIQFFICFRVIRTCILESRELEERRKGFKNGNLQVKLIFHGPFIINLPYFTILCD